MRWSGAIGAIARCKNRSTGYVHKHRSTRAWRWTCGAKPKTKAVTKPLHRFGLHGLDKPSVSTTVSKLGGRVYATKSIGHFAPVSGGVMPLHTGAFATPICRVSHRP